MSELLVDLSDDADPEHTVFVSSTTPGLFVCWDYAFFLQRYCIPALHIIMPSATKIGRIKRLSYSIVMPLAQCCALELIA